MKENPWAFTRGRIKGPGMPGSNEYNNPPDDLLMNAPGTGLDWEDFTGLEEPGVTPGFRDKAVSTRNRRSRRCEGPSQSGVKDLEYKGT